MENKHKFKIIEKNICPYLHAMSDFGHDEKGLIYQKMNIKRI
jgi:hypothetical protein